MIEIWKDIPGYPGYQCSNQGRVKSFRVGNEGRLRKLTYDYKGYLTVPLRLNGTSKLIKVHRLVMLTFVGPSNLQVNHIDGVKDNNNLQNLEYVTNQENKIHAILNGLTAEVKGIKHPRTNLTKQDVINIFKDKRICRLIADDYNLSRSAISSIKSRKNWTHITKDL